MNTLKFLKVFLLRNRFTEKIMKNASRFCMAYLIGCDVKFRRIFKELLNEKKILLNVRETWSLYDQLKKTAGLNGDIAELGVCFGGSAKLICQLKKDKRLHLFDTFCGLPKNDFSINKIKAGEIKGGTLKEVEDYLAGYSNIYYYKGIFPDTASELKKENLRFSFVHLDADIYEATLDGLKFFYPRMQKSGIILIHDYHVNHLPGVERAVSEFLKDKPEKVIPLRAARFRFFARIFNRYYDTTQAVIIKK